LHRIAGFSILIATLLLFSVLPVFVEAARAQTSLPPYWVTVNPTMPGLVVHSTVGLNLTISFKATWTHGNNYGEAIENATVPINVTTTDGTVVETLLPKTNATGFASFYYSSSTPRVLTFVPTELVAEDGTEWNSSLVDDAYGFQSEPLTIYWDRFAASLISADTSALWVARVTVNVTYLLIPEGGLTALQLPNYSQNDSIPKYVHGADVKIDGVKAEETSVPGVYTAQISSWLPTAYILVEVSQEGWPQTGIALSFTHSENEVVWASATIIGLICVVAPLAYYFFSSRRTRGHALFRKSGFLIIGAILLVIASFISVYWVMIGVESVLHGLDWLLLAVFGIVAFTAGLAGSVMSKMRRGFALALFAVCFPLLENAVVVKYSLDNYQLPTPWIAVAPAIIISTLSGILIGMSDEQFS
jgi:hypothetical protein